MKFINITKHLIVNFRTKHKLTIKNIHLNEEIWTIFISPSNIFFSFFAMLIVAFALVLSIVIYTPLLDMIPGYPGNKSREILLHSVVKLDSLERAIKNWEIYESNITTIMSGRTPVSITASKSVDSIKKVDHSVVPPTQDESNFRSSIEEDSESKKRAKEAEVNKRLVSFNLFAPLQGVITEYFSPVNKQYGVTISSPNPQEVLAVNNGAVILSEWTPNDGFIIQVQHSGNMISTYKKLSSQIKTVGDRVKGGEVIGFVGVAESDDYVTDKKPSLHFELWDSGVPVDPLNYILF